MVEKIFDIQQTNDREVIKRLLTIMEIMQASDFAYISSLVKQMYQMEQQMEQMQQKMMEMEVNMNNGHAVEFKGINLKEKFSVSMQKVEDTSKKVLTEINGLRKNIADQGREVLQNMKDTGKCSIYAIFDKIGLQQKLNNLHKVLENGIKNLNEEIDWVKDIAGELQEGRKHVKKAVNAVRGKEGEITQGSMINGIENIFVRPLEFVQDIYKNMLQVTNNLIGKYNSLEKSVSQKNSSILKKIEQYKSDEKKNANESVKKENWKEQER